MIRTIIYDAGTSVANVWAVSFLLADMRGEWHQETAATKLNHWICWPALVGWMASYVARPPTFWWALLSLPFPVLWWAVHKRYHNHKDTKRLLEAGRGLVQRFHNRLIVVPESAN